MASENKFNVIVKAYFITYFSTVINEMKMMFRVSKFMVLILWLIIIAAFGCNVSVTVNPASEKELRALITEESLPLLPENRDFQEQYEVRLTELKNLQFDWPSGPMEITMDASENLVYIHAGKVTISDIHRQFGQDVIEEIGQREYLLKSAIIIDGGYLEMEEVTLRLDATASTVQKNLPSAYIHRTAERVLVYQTL